MTAMAHEIREIPAAAGRLLGRQALLSAIADRIHAAAPRVVVTCGRGSSGHVGVYLRYLFEARIGLLVSAAAPSVITAYRKQPDMRNALFLVISQSGRSPDLVAATQSARRAGALIASPRRDRDSARIARSRGTMRCAYPAACDRP